MAQQLQLLVGQRDNHSRHRSSEAPRMLAVIGEGLEISAISDSRIYVSTPSQEDPDELCFKLHLALGHIGVPLYSEGLEPTSSRYKQLDIGKAALRIVAAAYHNSPWADDEPSVTDYYYWLPDLTNSARRVPMLGWEAHEHSIVLRDETVVIDVNNEAALKLQS